MAVPTVPRKLGPLVKCVSCDEMKPHHSRRLCNACYKRHSGTVNMERFPGVRESVSPRARYEDWVASGLTPNEYARLVGILNTSLVRALRVERERRDRLGLPWLTGWRKVRGAAGSSLAEVREMIASVNRGEVEERYSNAGGGGTAHDERLAGAS